MSLGVPGKSPFTLGEDGAVHRLLSIFPRRGGEIFSFCWLTMLMVLEFRLHNQLIWRISHYLRRVLYIYIFQVVVWDF